VNSLWVSDRVKNTDKLLVDLGYGELQHDQSQTIAPS